MRRSRKRTEEAIPSLSSTRSATTQANSSVSLNLPSGATTLQAADRKVPRPRGARPPENIYWM